MDFKKKYLKYKFKYENLKKQTGGGWEDDNDTGTSDIQNVESGVIPKREIGSYPSREKNIIKINEPFDDKFIKIMTIFNFLKKDAKFEKHTDKELMDYIKTVSPDLFK